MPCIKLASTYLSDEIICLPLKFKEMSRSNMRFCNLSGSRVAGALHAEAVKGFSDAKTPRFELLPPLQRLTEVVKDV